MPLDGSARAEAALPVAVELARAAAATLVLWRATPHTAVLAGVSDPAPWHSVTAACRAAWDEAYLAQAPLRLPAGVRSEAVQLVGSPMQDLVPYARRSDVDLTVMAARGRGGLRRLVLGSIARHIVQSGLPTLLVPVSSP